MLALALLLALLGLAAGDRVAQAAAPAQVPLPPPFPQPHRLPHEVDCQAPAPGAAAALAWPFEYPPGAPAGTADLAQVRTWTRVAFVSARSGQAELYTMRADGSDLRRLTDHPSAEARPALNPGATRIVFDADYDGDTRRELWLVNVDGGGLSRLTTAGGDNFDASWMEDGASIAFTSNRTGDLEIFLIAADGSGERQISQNRGLDLMPVPIPDTDLLAWTYDPAPSFGEVRTWSPTAGYGTRTSGQYAFFPRSGFEISSSSWRYQFPDNYWSSIVFSLGGSRKAIVRGGISGNYGYHLVLEDAGPHGPLHPVNSERAFALARVYAYENVLEPARGRSWVPRGSSLWFVGTQEMRPVLVAPDGCSASWASEDLTPPAIYTQPLPTRILWPWEWPFTPLRWFGVDDKSGIAYYHVQAITGSLVQDRKIVETGIDPFAGECSEFGYKVRSRNNAGIWGDWSLWEQSRTFNSYIVVNATDQRGVPLPGVALHAPTGNRHDELVHTDAYGRYHGMVCWPELESGGTYSVTLDGFAPATYEFVLRPYKMDWENLSFTLHPSKTFAVQAVTPIHPAGLIGPWQRPASRTYYTVKHQVLLTSTKSIANPTLNFGWSVYQEGDPQNLFFVEVTAGDVPTPTRVYSATTQAQPSGPIWVDLSPWYGQLITITSGLQIGNPLRLTQVQHGGMVVSPWFTPQLLGIDPSVTEALAGGVSGAEVAATRTYTLTGENFLPGVVARLDDRALPTTRLDEHMLLVQAPAALAPGLHELWVTNTVPDWGTFTSALSGSLRAGRLVYLPLASTR